MVLHYKKMLQAWQILFSSIQTQRGYCRLDGKLTQFHLLLFLATQGKLLSLIRIFDISKLNLTHPFRSPMMINSVILCQSRFFE